MGKGKKRKSKDGIEKFGKFVLPLYYSMTIVLVVLIIILAINLWG